MELMGPGGEGPSRSLLPRFLQPCRELKAVGAWLVGQCRGLWGFVFFSSFEDCRFERQGSQPLRAVSRQLRAVSRQLMAVSRQLRAGS